MELKFKNVEELIELIKQNADEIAKSRELKLVCIGEQHCSNIDFSQYGLDFEKLFGKINTLSFYNCTAILSDLENGISYFSRMPKLSFTKCNIDKLENISYEGDYSGMSVKDSNIDFSGMDINEESFFSDMFSGSPNLQHSTCKCRDKEYQELLSVMSSDEIEYSELTKFDKLLGYIEGALYENVKGKKKILINTIEEFYELIETGKLIEATRSYFGLSETFFETYSSNILDEIPKDKRGFMSKFIVESMGYRVNEKTFEWDEKNNTSKRTKNEDEIILEISDASELSLEDIEKLEKKGIKIDKVFIRPQKDKIDDSKITEYKWSHVPYSIEEYKKCRKAIDEILADVEERKPDGSNELDIFMQIYTRLAYLIKYNEDALSADADESVKIQNACMTGALLCGEAICTGYAETLRNVLACRNIECIFIESEYNLNYEKKTGMSHAYNQVKINGKWYYVDMTWDRDSLIEGESLRYCLVSKEDFEKTPEDQSDKHHKDQLNWRIESATETYPREDIQRLYDKNKSAIFDKHKEKVEEDIELFAKVLEFWNGKSRPLIESLKEKFWDKNSSEFEEGMLELGKQLGWIKDDATYSEAKQYGLSRRYDGFRLMYKLGSIKIKEYKKVRLREWYEELGLKTSDLEVLMKIESLESQKTKEEGHVK